MYTQMSKSNGEYFCQIGLWSTNLKNQSISSHFNSLFIFKAFLRSFENEQETYGYGSSDPVSSLSQRRTNGNMRIIIRSSRKQTDFILYDALIRDNVALKL